MKLFGRPIRPGNQPVPSTPVTRGTINPKDPVNAPRALSYPGLNVSIIFKFYNKGDWLMFVFLTFFVFQPPVLSDFVVDLFSRQVSF